MMPLTPVQQERLTKAVADYQNDMESYRSAGKAVPLSFTPDAAAHRFAIDGIPADSKALYYALEDAFIVAFYRR